MAKAENIDPERDGSRYAWAENVGWISAKPSSDPRSGVQVGDGELSGWMYSENVGWISLSCKNTLTCATTEYGVRNDGNGVLTGFAWGENIGWINFAPSDSGVTIDRTSGTFAGSAWAENVGWISFNCANTDTCGDVEYRVKAGWICDPPPRSPAGSADLRLDKSGSHSLLSWTRVAEATASDIVFGNLGALRDSPVALSTSTLGCLDVQRTTTSLLESGPAEEGSGFWFLVRGRNCRGRGTYGTPARDIAIHTSGNDCTVPASRESMEDTSP